MHRWINLDRKSAFCTLLCCLRTIRDMRQYRQSARCTQGIDAHIFIIRLIDYDSARLL